MYHPENNRGIRNRLTSICGKIDKIQRDLAKNGGLSAPRLILRLREIEKSIRACRRVAWLDHIEEAINLLKSCATCAKDAQQAIQIERVRNELEATRDNLRIMYR